MRDNGPLFALEQNNEDAAEFCVNSMLGGVPRILGEASALHGGNGNAVRATIISAKLTRQRLAKGLVIGMRISFGGGHSSGGRKARPARTHDQGGRLLIALRVCGCR
jgi:hypothetical protein